MTRTMRGALATTWVVCLLVSALVVAGLLVWDQQRRQQCTDHGWQPVAGRTVLCVDQDGVVRSPR
jgi:hypothetical protein